jgi:hypothetical protein
MSGLVVFGDLVFLALGYAACWFSKSYVEAAIAWVKAKF